MKKWKNHASCCWSVVRGAKVFDARKENVDSDFDMCVYLFCRGVEIYGVLRKLGFTVAMVIIL